MTDPRVAEFLSGVGDLDSGQTVQFLRDMKYRHDPEWKQGRCRAYKHENNPDILTVREYPPGKIIGGEARKVRNHVRKTFGVSEEEKQNEKPND